MNWELVAAHVGPKSRRGYRAVPPVHFTGFPHGLNTSVPASQLLPTECAELVNFRLVDGRPQTRPPIIPYPLDFGVGYTPVAVAAEYAPIGGTWYELFEDSTDQLYYNDGLGALTSLANLADRAQFLPYKDAVLLLDGSYIKYISDVAQGVRIAYDNGTGLTSFLTTNLTGTAATPLALGNGTISRVAHKFTTVAFGTSSFPVLSVAFNLTREGNGFTGTDNVPIVVSIRKVSDDSTVFSTTLVAAPIATNLAAVAAEYDLDVSGDLLPSTAYYLCVEYANGDATHHVKVNCSSTADVGTAYTYAAAAWTLDDDKTPLAGIKPGLPPKASFGVVFNQRPFVSGDPDHPGYVWFGNLSYLDWSTADGGGYVGSIDNDANSYPIGGLATLYEQLYVFGTEASQFISRLTGASPDEYALPEVAQRSWTVPRGVLSTPNDIWFANSDHVSNLVGVQQYGDIRSFPHSDPISDRISSYWSDDVVMEYYPILGQLLLAFPSYHRVLACHVHFPSRVGSTIRYPWSEYEFTGLVLTSSTYKFTHSPTVQHEYYLELAAGGDPSLPASPDALLLDGVLMNKETVGSLSDHTWGYGDGDTLGYSTVYVRDSSGAPSATGVEIRTCIIPSMLKYMNGKMLIGSTDGNVYTFSDANYLENSQQMRFDLRTSFFQPHIDAVVLERFAADIGGTYGAQIDLSVYINRKSRESAVDFTFNLSLDDRINVDDLPAIPHYFLVDPSYDLVQDWVQVEGYLFQFRLHNVLLSGGKITLNSIEGYIRPLEV